MDDDGADDGCGDGGGDDDDDDGDGDDGDGGARQPHYCDSLYMMKIIYSE